jgi:hypothetical protein
MRRRLSRKEWQRSFGRSQGWLAQAVREALPRTEDKSIRMAVTEINESCLRNLELVEALVA